MIKTDNISTSSAVPCAAEIGVPMIRIVICDDNPVFLKNLREEIRKVLDSHSVDAAINAFTDVERIPEDALASCDVFLLDIDFVDKRYTGIDVARWIRKLRPDVIIIFVTSYIEYAPEGYEVQAFRYILKDEISRKLEQCILESLSKLKSDQGKFQINISGETISIPMNDILYFESQAHQAVLYVLKKGAATVKTYRFYSALSALENHLSSQGFLRIHKSYLVNMRRLKKYQCTEAVLDNGTVLRVSTKSYAEQKKQYLLWKGRK